jgi:hypothetical protein
MVPTIGWSNQPMFSPHMTILALHHVSWKCFSVEIAAERFGWFAGISLSVVIHVHGDSVNIIYWLVYTGGS